MHVMIGWVMQRSILLLIYHLMSWYATEHNKHECHFPQVDNIHSISANIQQGYPQVYHLFSSHYIFQCWDHHFIVTLTWLCDYLMQLIIGIQGSKDTFVSTLWITDIVQHYVSSPWLGLVYLQLVVWVLLLLSAILVCISWSSHSLNTVWMVYFIWNTIEITKVLFSPKAHDGFAQFLVIL